MTRTSVLEQVVDSLDRAMDVLRGRPEFASARDFCACVREGFYAIYAEYLLDPEGVDETVKKRAYEIAVEGAAFLRGLKVPDTAEVALVHMYAESVEFRCEMMKILFCSGPEQVFRRQVIEIQKISSAPFAADETKEYPAPTSLLLDIAVEMYKDHGPSPHALGTFARLLDRFVIRDLPRLTFSGRSTEIRNAVRDVGERLSRGHADEKEARGILETEAEALCRIAMRARDTETDFIVRARLKIARCVADGEFLCQHSGKTIVFFGDEILGEGIGTQDAFNNAMDTAAHKGLSPTAEQIVLLAVPSVETPTSGTSRELSIWD